MHLLGFGSSCGSLGPWTDRAVDQENPRRTRARLLYIENSLNREQIHISSLV